MTLAVSLADYVLGTIAPHDLPAVALRALLDGHESSSLAALAGVSPQTYDRWEVEGLLDAALRELHLRLPSRGEAAQVIIDDSVRRALASELSPVGAISRIVNGAYYASGAPERDSTVAGDSLGLGEIVGIYWMYDEADQPWSPTAEELDRGALEALERLRARRDPTPG